tara:strand:- start:5373 stop:5948 length:576 start_codon:yes stop_codon:yes gene_type:complete
LGEFCKFNFGVFVGLFLIGLLFLGPLPAISYSPNNWMNHFIFQYSYKPNHFDRYMLPRKIPEFYENLRKIKSKGMGIVEALWFYFTDHNPFPYYKKTHGWPMKIGFVRNKCLWAEENELPLTWKKLKLINFISIDYPKNLLLKKIRFLIIHQNLKKEIPIFSMNIKTYNNAYSRDMTECINSLKLVYKNSL